MSDDLIAEYAANAESAESIDYSDLGSVRRFNGASDRMRAIASQVASQGRAAISVFAILLDHPAASVWAAHHLVEMAELEPALLSKCFARVERAKKEAEANSEFATAMGERMWLKEWRAKR